MNKKACVALVRNEAMHIAEWIAWQLAIGFDAVILLDNGSTDATRREASVLSGSFDVRLFDWPVTSADYQIRGYEFAARTLAREFDWLAFFDTDEFLVLDAGLSLAAVLDDRLEAAAIGVPWAIFGSSGHREVPTGLVIENFVHRAPEDFFPNRHIKSMIRPSRMRRALNPHAFDMQGEYTGLDGQPIAFASPGLLAETPAYRGGKLHHYFTRSWTHWQAKLARGYRDMSRPESDFHSYDRNEVFDDSAARRKDIVKQILATPSPVRSATAEPRLGIAITTFNRKDMLLDQIAAIKALTTSPYDLVICDDGSTDGTLEALQEQGVTIISGFNRGIAWNKNRGLYYLLNIAQSDILLLLDDDVIPTVSGWQAAWISAVWRFGHINDAHADHRGFLIAGALTSDYPGLTPVIPGWALGFSRLALAQIGYFDTRFGRYGHEHADISFRAVRAGFGGVEITEGGRNDTLFYVIEGGLTGVPSQTCGTAAELNVNLTLLNELRQDSIYRHAWRDDDEMAVFLEEIRACLPAGLKRAFKPRNRLPSLGAYRACRD